MMMQKDEMTVAAGCAVVHCGHVTAIIARDQLWP